MDKKKVDALLQSTQIDTPAELADKNIEDSCATWPMLPGEALYGIAGEVVELATKNNEIDRASILLTCLSWFAASAGSSPHINIGDTQHPPRLFAILVGASSRARKGASERPVRRLFERAEELLNLTKLNVSPGPLSTGEGLIDEVRDPSPSNPTDRGVEDKRLLCIESEFSSVLRMNKREGNSLSCTLRSAWDSGNIKPLTRNNKLSTTGAHICILGHITHHELMAMLNSTDTFNGFANRFLWACVRRKAIVALPEPMPEEEVDVLARKLGEAIVFSKQQKSIRFSEEAKKFWIKQYPLVTIDHPGKYGAVTSRAEAQVLRLSLVYALLDSKNVIDVCHLEAALALWGFCDESARFIFGDACADPNLQKILDHLKNGEKTTTELHSLFGRHMAKETLNEALRTLQSMGKVSSRNEGGGFGKGKAATFWFLASRDVSEI